MADMKESYTLMFTDYPDIVNLTQMRKMLGGISNSLAYRMLREKKIKSKKVGREYKIPKVNVIKYVMTEQ
ncbi:MAG: helix-turn-helix domain-containing protein [Clostridia bacterium]|jgi:excisionase family DNA binding protein|uniref:helix-turn-helix domain-containing protein n=1 Tax=Candidatus Merdicola sp. TaxID=3085652 RepID=UPI0015AFFA32|nr:helix-turn-helix domain-containing protein [Clostridia bacterium]